MTAMGADNENEKCIINVLAATKYIGGCQNGTG